MFMFLGTFNLSNLLSESRTMALGERDRVFVVQAARKLLQVRISHKWHIIVYAFRVYGSSVN